MSGESNDDLLYRYAALGAREFFAKPVDVERLVQWVKLCSEHDPQAQPRKSVAI
jgi:FixJ family two-component response regulator